MKNAIFQFEFRYWLKSPVFYFFVICFFLLAFVTMIGTGGFFDGPITTTEKVNLLNSPYELSSISLLFSKFLLLFVAVVAGNGLFRDYKNNTHAILYSFPIRKRDYLDGKLGSGLLMITVASTITILGILIGEFILGTSNPKIGDFNLMSYLTALGVYLVPTMLIIGGFVFTVVGVTRNIFAGFMTVILFVLFQLMLENIFFGNRTLLALLDPFGQNAFMFATMDWNFATKNTGTIPVDLVVILNRLLWLALTFGVLSIFYRKFDFQYDAIWNPGRFKKKEAKNVYKKTSLANTSEISYKFSKKARIQAFINLMLFDFKSIFKNVLFLFLTGFGILTIFFIQLKVTNTGEFNLQPFTRILLGGPFTIYSMIIIIGTFLFSGILIHKGKQYNMNALIDVTAVNNWQLISSKIGAVLLLQIFQLFLFMFLGIGIQTFNGYFNYEIGLYIFHLFVLTLPILLVWNITSAFVHSLLPNIFLGLFVLLGIWFGAQGMEQLGIQTNLLRFNTFQPMDYSDFSGYGYQLRGYLLLLLYWFMVGLLIFASTFLIWNRGTLSSFSERWKISKSRMNKYLAGLLILMLVNVGWLGYKIYQVESFDQQQSVFFTGGKNLMKLYKEKWAKYEQTPQPKISNIYLELDIYPNKNNFTAKGNYTLINDNDTPIDTVFVRTGFDEISSINWAGKATLILEDDKMKSHLYKLNSPLAPKDSISFSFDIKNTPNTIFTRNSNVLSNGSYIKQDVLPRIGYQFDEHDTSIDNHSSCNHHFYHRDADVVHIHTKVSTQEGQMAIAPGVLINQKKDGSRNIFEYKTKHPVKINFSFHSAAYEQLSDQYNDVKIDIYFQKGHEANAASMIEGIKASLDYNTENFSAYPYDQIRIVEFPHTEESYTATLVTNNIPTSEILFNINTAAMVDRLNLPFYVMVHEVTHEWFGNQVTPAAVEGAKMLTESITEYLTLCIYRKQLGEKIANEFLKIQHKRYHKGRKKETAEEPSLSQVKSHQQYIAYGKGAVTFNHLAHEIGTENMTKILLEYVKKFKGKPTCYATTDDFINLIEANIPETQHNFVFELFNTNNYYDNKIVAVNTLNQNEVELTFNITKKSGTTDQAIDTANQSIEIGQFDSNGNLVKVEKMQVITGNNTIKIALTKEAKTISLDPNLLLIDRNFEDNSIEL